MNHEFNENNNEGKLSQPGFLAQMLISFPEHQETGLPARLDLDFFLRWPLGLSVSLGVPAKRLLLRPTSDPLNQISGGGGPQQYAILTPL